MSEEICATSAEGYAQKDGSRRGEGGCKSFDPATSEKPNRKSSERKWRLISKRQRSNERRRQIERYRQRETEREREIGGEWGKETPRSKFNENLFVCGKSSEN